MPGKLSRAPGDVLAGYKIDHNSVDEFYISLDFPHKLYLPGEEVSGQVILKTRKNLANIAIVFLLSGFVKLNALPLLKLRPLKHVLFNHTIKIYGPETPQLNTEDVADDFANGLYKGEHRFPFIVKLPNKRVYTSIDFGKGAIVYVLKTILRSANAPEYTEPNSPGASPSNDLFARARSLSKLHLPSYTLEKIITLVDPIDVSTLPPPKPKRLIIRDPRSNRVLSRVQLLTSTATTAPSISSYNSDNESMHTPQDNATPGLLIAKVSPGNASMVLGGGDQVRPNAIRVTMEVAHRGFIRGELIPIKLTINHLKKIQDSRGIIVTLVRVCHLDYGPDGSYETFRKDLAQLVVPLFVDPTTFASEINTSLRVPPDAFPTISKCPTVSFQYFVEVMLNLSGRSLSLEGPSEQPKLTTQEVLNVGLSPGASNLPSGFSFRPVSALDRSDFINTDKYKRSRKFLQITSEIIIGTHRLEKADRSPDSIANSPMAASTSVTDSNSPHSNVVRHSSTSNAFESIPETVPVSDFEIPPYIAASSAAGGTFTTAPTYEDTADARLPTPMQSALSEKDRMRIREESLLPSEPQLDISDPDEPLTVSPIDPGTDILENVLADRELDANGDSTILFFTPAFPSALSPNFDDDDLYDTPDIHEGIGLDGITDYVPNYDSAVNDRLVAASSRNTNTT